MPGGLKKGIVVDDIETKLQALRDEYRVARKFGDKILMTRIKLKAYSIKVSEPFTKRVKRALS